MSEQRKQGSMTTRTVRRYGGLLVALALLLIASQVAHAQEQSLYWERFDVEVDIREDGTLRVTEDNDVNFTSGIFRYGFREIADERVTALRDFEVVVDGVPLSQDSSAAPGTFYLYEGDDGQGIRYLFPEPTSGRHHITLSYTVDGGIRYYEDGDQLWWEAVYADRPATVEQSLVRVRLPQPISAEQLVIASYGSPATSEIAEGGNVVTFVAGESLPPGEALTVRVQWPHGIVSGSAPPWQAEADRLDRVRSQVNLLVPALSLIVLIGGLLAIFMLWYTRGRDQTVALTADYLSEPPSDLPAGVVGTLIDEQADLKDVMATLLALAQKGALRIEESKAATTGWLNAKPAEFTFELLDRSKATSKAERTLLNKFFGRTQQRELADLKEKFYKSLPAIQEALYEDAIERGFFGAHPNQTRNRYRLGGVVLLILGGVGLFAMAALLVERLDTPAPLCLPAALVFLGVALMLAAQAMPRKTAAGSEAASRWQAFRRYLQGIDRYGDLEEKKAIWDQYLPYAVAFGLDQSYIQKFASVNAPVPNWYVPYGYGYGYPHHSSTGGRSADRSGGSGGVQDALGGRTGGGLQGASNSMALGLQGMSSGLSSMLSTTASTLTSSPSSSGSGGGGGFSGGGGGSSGGGSGGFG